MTIHSQKRRNWRRNFSHLTMLSSFFLLLFSLLVTQHALAQNPPAGTVHSVVLTWQAPSPVGGSGTVAGYNVYRAITGVNYAKVNQALITDLTATDTNVVSGTTYGYCATTVDSGGSESPCTIPVNAVVPSNPNIPTALTAAVR